FLKVDGLTARQGDLHVARHIKRVNVDVDDALLRVGVGEAVACGLRSAEQDGGGNEQDENRGEGERDASGKFQTSPPREQVLMEKGVTCYAPTDLTPAPSP